MASEVVKYVLNALSDKAEWHGECNAWGVYFVSGGNGLRCCAAGICVLREPSIGRSRRLILYDMSFFSAEVSA